MYAAVLVLGCFLRNASLNTFMVLTRASVTSIPLGTFISLIEVLCILQKKTYTFPLCINILWQHNNANTFDSLIFSSCLHSSASLKIHINLECVVILVTVNCFHVKVIEKVEN